MSISDVMTSLMNKFREKTNLTDKLSIQRATSLMDHFDLHVNPNLLVSTSIVCHTDPNYPMWSNVAAYLTTGKPLEPGKTYTLSWCAKTSGNNSTVRVRIFNPATNVTIPDDSAGTEFKLTSSRQSYTFTMPNDATGYFVYLYGSATLTAQDKDVTFYDCKLEYGDLATPLTESGATQSASSASQSTQPAASASGATQSAASPATR